MDNDQVRGGLDPFYRPIADARQSEVADDLGDQAYAEAGGDEADQGGDFGDPLGDSRFESGIPAFIEKRLSHADARGVGKSQKCVVLEIDELHGGPCRQWVFVRYGQDESLCG